MGRQQGRADVREQARVGIRRWRLWTSVSPLAKMDDSDGTRTEARHESHHHPPLQDRATKEQQKRRRVMRDNIQKKVHNVVEQKRKAKMAAWINDINSLLPKSDPRKDSINLVLERAYQFIVELKDSNDKLLDGKFSDVEKEEFEKMKSEVKHLKDLNERYVKLLKLAGISPALIPPDPQSASPAPKSVHVPTDDSSSSSSAEEVIHCRHRRPRRRSCHRRCQSDIVNTNSSSCPQVVVIRADLPAATPAPSIVNEVSAVDHTSLSGSGSSLILGSNLLQTGATYILTSTGQLLPVAQVVTTESGPSLGTTNCSASIASFSSNNISQNHAQPALHQNGQQNSSSTAVPIIATSSHNFHVSSLLNDGGNSAADSAIPIEPIDNQVGSRITSSCNSAANDYFHPMGQPVVSMRNSFRSNNFHVNNLLTDVVTTPASDQAIQSSVPIDNIDHNNQMGSRTPSFCVSNSSDYYQPRGQSSHSFRTQTFRSNNFHVNNLLTDNSAPGVETTVHSGAPTEMIDKSLTPSRTSSSSYNTNQPDYYQSRGQTPSSWMNPMSRW